MNLTEDNGYKLVKDDKGIVYVSHTSNIPRTTNLKYMSGINQTMNIIT